MTQRTVSNGWAERSWVLWVVLAVAAGCDGRNLGAGAEDGAAEDGAVEGDAQPTVDSEVVDPCAPMDAAEALAQCDDPAPVVGWAWDGSCCVPIHCICVGPDCDRLHASESACAETHVPGCISVTPCEDREYNDCEEQPGCEMIFYGGGCFNMAECNPGGGDPDDMLCIEQAVACVPVGQPCSEREQWDCNDDCFWVQHDSELCYEQCCFDEGYGYCASLPSCDCEPQQIDGCMDPCGGVAGYYWDGSFCQPIICCCEGPDCGETWETAEACWAARATCPTSACGEARGYCIYGDFDQPSCSEGFGTNWDTGDCGLGVCCTPCPEVGDPEVWYASHDPTECQTLEIDCGPSPALRFDNECGCGCIGSP